MQRSKKRSGILLLSIVLTLCLDTGACGRDEGAEQEAASLQLSFARGTTYMEVGDTASLQLSNEGRLAPVLDSIRWFIDDTTVAVVHTGTGLVTGVAEGATRAWARLGNDSVSTILVVEARTELFVLNPRVFAFDAVGEVENLELLSIGRDPLPEGDLAEYCSSTDPAVVEVGSGPVVRPVGSGTAYIKCEIAWTADSVLVEVWQRPVRIAIIESRVRPIGVERDSIVLQLATIDRLGSPIYDVTPTWRSLNARIVQIDRESGAASGVSFGSARIVAEYEELADTIRLEVRNDVGVEAPIGLPPATVLGLDREYSIEQAAQEEADFFTDEFGEPAIADRRVAETGPAIPMEDARITEILSAQEIIRGAGIPRGRPIVFAAVAGIADHRVDFGSGAEKTSGPVFGAEFDLPIAGRLSMHGQALTGKLSSGVSGIEDRTLFDVGAKLSYGALPWGNLELGSGVRSYETTFSTQRWSSLSAGGSAHLGALDGLIRAHVAFAFLPFVAVSGTESPSLGLLAGAGVNFRQGRFTAGFRYELERFSFPDRLGIRRIEQYALIRFRIGLALGGN